MNTNSTPTYGRPSLELFYKGGLFYHNESIPATLTGNAKSIERGEACSRSVLSLFAWGDSSILTAAKKGKIKIIAHIEYEHTAVLAIMYHSFCTIVTGESKPSPNCLRRRIRKIETRL
nr:TRL-like family protein [Leptospira stimsonii]